jgi:diaminohydroxyphosphoribosylaminopyrimidine deaminase/5-amino-6-(5-phosphoribosylamino)uracil reductase
MGQALSLAHKSLTLSTPNPRVGCVLVSAEGTVLGTGYTQRAGGAHAEVMAIQDAIKRGQEVRGATAYVTLEPCSHFGRTGPCCEVLIQSGIKKVVASIADPNPLVQGRGFARLRNAGIEVEIGDGEFQSRELNIGFFSRMIRKRPWVRMKIAASLDGTTALNNGSSQWITDVAARNDGHLWRARSCAILTGIGTVLVDNPKLDVRLQNVSRQPKLILVDSRLEVRPSAHLFIASRACYIYTAAPSEINLQTLKRAEVSITQMANSVGKVDLTAMMLDLGKREINELHVEAGFKLNGSLINANLVDEFLVYLAPKFLGQGQGMLNFGPLEDLGQVRELEFVSTEMVGKDLRLIARAAGHADF